MYTWISDSNGNRCSVEYWGSEEEARRALASLESCSGCSDCSCCYDCHGCFRSYGCYGCSGCSGCSDCFRCSGGSRLSPQPAQFKVPKIEGIHTKLFEAVTQTGKLQMDSWHTCETTHCRAGWIVHLAGKTGYDLEKRTSAEFAAMQIYKASGYAISPVRFYETNEVAMADIKRLAELEAKGEAVS